MKLKWTNKNLSGEPENLKKIAARYDDFTISVFEETFDGKKASKCWWIISTPKSEFNLTSKRPFSDFERCREQAENVFKALVS